MWLDRGCGGPLVGYAGEVAMFDIVMFVVVFVGFFLLRGIAATVFFYFILPEGDRCPNCDAVTLRVQSRGWNLIAPRLRTSWCYECNWHGLLRNGPLTPVASSRNLTKTREG
jgi:hypothetical protein